MKKCFFFFMFFIILASGRSYSEAQDKKQIVDKKDDAKQMVIKGNKAFSAQRYDEAITLYKQAIALDPDSVNANYDLGVAYGKKDMLDESISAYNRVISINPRHAQAHNNLGSTYEKKGMADKALSEYEKAVEADPDLPPALYNLGKSYLTRGSHEKAAGYLYKAGILFHKSKNIEWAKKSYNLLQQTHSGDLEKALYELLNTDAQGKAKENIDK